ncbi:DNA polymerase III subunit delta [Rubripirellula lacrimiformis]|uniref:DNA-directed DNA polymerase n=1 Tax=Rubripirellula lacrimiformis TaxID=1930273 RepID=A0A517N626_9BACT|nr:DNA polymerase III subunit delta [Rubripirellula lacrimiformis]QDT02583.1 DNA polymerase III subunit delta [Rubripirellula lacrimiformis]
MTLIHAFEMLPDPPTSVPDVVAVFGADATLRSWSMLALSACGDATQFDGETTKWSDLRDDLATASLFDMGGGKRTIMVRNADKFVSDHRPEIEKYLAKPGSASRLILDLESLASNTKIYKAILKDQMLVACGNTTDAKSGVTAATRRKFLTGYVAKRYKTKIDKTAADALHEMLGDEIGMMDTEIAKLALYIDPGGKIDEALVRDVVAGWQGKTVWQITDAIAAGDAAEAIRQLDKLLSGGQRAIALLPQIAWSLRRLGMATAIVEQRERSGRRIQLEDALASAGCRRPSEIQQAKKQLIGLGRGRARQLLPWLLDADLRLKGTHSAEGRDRFLLEQLVLKMAKTKA